MKPVDSRKLTNWGRWHEAGLDLLEYLAVTWPDATLALQLSTLFPPVNDALRIPDPAETRRMHDILSQGTPAAITKLTEYHHDHVILWAPTTHDTLLRVLGALKKWTKTNTKKWRITLLAPAALPPLTRRRCTNITIQCPSSKRNQPLETNINIRSKHG